MSGRITNLSSSIKEERVKERERDGGLNNVSFACFITLGLLEVEDKEPGDQAVVG